MAISRKSAGASFGSNVVSFTGTYAANDVIVIVAVTVSSSTVPSLPSGYTLITNGSDSTNGWAMSMFYKVATSSSETGPTISGASAASWAIYGGVNTTTPFTNPAGQTGTTTSVSYSGIVTMTQSGGAGTSWVLYTATGKGGGGGLFNAIPTSSALVGATSNFQTTAPAYEIDIFDTNAAVSAASFNTKTSTAAVPWISKTVEMNASTGGGGGGTPTNLFFF